MKNPRSSQWAMGLAAILYLVSWFAPLTTSQYREIMQCVFVALIWAGIYVGQEYQALLATARDRLREEKTRADMEAARVADLIVVIEQWERTTAILQETVESQTDLLRRLADTELNPAKASRPPDPSDSDEAHYPPVPPPPYSPR